MLRFRVALLAAILLSGIASIEGSNNASIRILPWLATDLNASFVPFQMCSVTLSNGTHTTFIADTGQCHCLLQLADDDVDTGPLKYVHESTSYVASQINPEALVSLPSAFPTAALNDREAASIRTCGIFFAGLSYSTSFGGEIFFLPMSENDEIGQAVRMAGGLRNPTSMSDPVRFKR